MSFYRKYVGLCNEIGKTPSAVALEIGISKPSVNRWKNGGGVTDATAQRIADYFGVEVSTLLDKGDDREEEKKPPAGSRELYAGDMEFWRKVIEYAPPEELKEIIIRATEKLADLK